MAVAYKVAGNSNGRHIKGAILDELGKTNPWEPWYAWRPKRVNNKWYWCTWIYRRFVLSPGGGFYVYGDQFDYLKWEK
jgi:hypothetical protein